MTIRARVNTRNSQKTVRTFNVGSTVDSFGTVSANNTSLSATLPNSTLTIIPGTGINIVGNSTNNSLVISNSSTISNNSVTLAHIQNVSSNTFLGRISSGSGTLEELTQTNAKSMLGMLTSSVAGRLPKYSDSNGNIISTSGLFEDASGNVGIGTTSPTTTLHADTVSNGLYSIYARKGIGVSESDSVYKNFIISSAEFGTRGGLEIRDILNTFGVQGVRAGFGQFDGTNDAQIRLLAIGTLNQTADLFQVRNGLDAVLVKITPLGRVGINVDTPLSNLDIGGTIRLSTSTQENYTTPVGSAVPTKINIPIFAPAAFGQLVAMGLPSGADISVRALSLFDARTVSHQPTLAVFSPGESDIIGFSWEGSDSTAYMKTVAAHMAIRVNATDIATFKSTGLVGIGTTSPGYKLDVMATSNQFAISYDATYNTRIGTTDIGRTTFNNNADIFMFGGTVPTIRLTTSNFDSLYSDWQHEGVNGGSMNNYQGSFSFNNQANTYMQFRTNNTARITIEAAGNIGIRTESPTGAFDIAAASLVSIPAAILTGAWYTGGTATTNKPHFLIEPAGTTSTGWVGTTGTGLGINAPTGFTGRLFDAQLNGVTKFNISYNGVVTIATNLFVTGTIRAQSDRFSVGHGNNGANVGTDSYYGFGSATATSAPDVGLQRSSAGVIKIMNGSSGGGALEWIEQTAPSAGSNNTVRIYAEDNGAGKTKLMALFSTGVAQQIAIEP